MHQAPVSDSTGGDPQRKYVSAYGSYTLYLALHLMCLATQDKHPTLLANLFGRVGITLASHLIIWQEAPIAKSLTWLDLRRIDFPY
jgi:hypothetical protein